MIENKNKANCYDENWPNFDVMVAKALEFEGVNNSTD